MKRISVSSLLICFVMTTGSLYAQFDGQNGQASFYSEVEQENRPDFLKMEEEAMLMKQDIQTGLFLTEIMDIQTDMN